MSNRLHELLQKRPYLLADGATGTNLFEMGLETGDAPELWNADHPERIAANYRSFIEAGSDIILTNSFGGTHFRLNLHNAAHRVKELNTLAVEIAKQEVAKVDREVLIAGDIGPTGEILEPTGSVSIEAATAAFTEQAQALADPRADLLWI